MLDLAAAGIRDAGELPWMDAPPSGPMQAARALLSELRLVDDGGSLTPVGRAAARLPVHPRLARMLVTASSAESRTIAADLAALLNERDLIRFEGSSRDPDIRLRLEALAAIRGKRGFHVPAGAVVHRDAAVDRGPLLRQ